MRIFIAVLVLIFSLQSWTKADDISEFEIEGVSIGDSLLDFMDIDDIKRQLITNDHLYSYTDKKFISILVIGLKSEIYNKRIIAEVKRKNDLKFIIYSVRGEMIFPGISKCLDQRKNITTDLKSIFPNAKKREWIRDFPGYKDSKYKTHGTNFDLDSGASIGIICSRFPRDLTPKRDDSFYVFIRSSEFENWLGKY